MPDREGSVDKRACSCTAYLRSPYKPRNSLQGSKDICLIPCTEPMISSVRSLPIIRWRCAEIEHAIIA